MGELISELKAEIDRLQALHLDRTKTTHKALVERDEKIERLTAEVKVLQEYYDASEAAWCDVIDVWASDADGRALHDRYSKAQKAYADLVSGRESP